jgi:hypothetical protein
LLVARLVMQRFLAIALATLLLIPGSAHADVIHLSNGTKLEGTIVELTPEDSLLVRDASGTERRVPWADLASIERSAPPAPAPAAPAPAPAPAPAAPAPAPAPAAPAPAPAPAAPAPATPATVRLDATGAAGALVERQDPQGVYQFACRVPCKLDLPKDGLYRISGPGLRPSKPFRLTPDESDRVALQITPASTVTYDTGFALTLAGSAALTLGAVVAYAGVLDTSGYSRQRQSNGLITGGLLLMVGGGLTDLVGIPLLIGSDATEVRQQSVPRREPVSPVAMQNHPMPPQGFSFSLPIAGGTF